MMIIIINGSSPTKKKKFDITVVDCILFVVTHSFPPVVNNICFSVYVNGYILTVV